MLYSCLYYIFRQFLPDLILCSIILSFNCGSGFEILLDEEPDSLFWTETGGQIKRIYIDGTGEKAVLTASNTPLDIALYLPGRQVYWTEYSAADSQFQIRRTGIDGSGNELFYYESSAGFNHGPSAIAIDPENTVIYWNYYKIPALINDIYRSALGTLNAVKWENSLSKSYTYSICLDTINRKIYFTANSYWDILSGFTFGLGNTGAASYGALDVSNSYYDQISRTGPASPSVPLRGMAVDGVKGYVYFVSNTSNPEIIRSDLILQNPIVWIDSGSFGIQKLALDLNNRKIYWTSDTDNGIYRADLDTQNSGIEKFLQLASKPTGVAITY